VREVVNRGGAGRRFFRRAPSAVLHHWCSGPVQAVRSGVWPRCHGVPGWIHRVGIRQVVAWHQAWPASTTGFHQARSFWCRPA